MSLGIYFCWLGIAILRTLTAYQWWPDGPKDMSVHPRIVSYLFLLACIGGVFHILARVGTDESGAITGSDLAKVGAVLFALATVAGAIYFW